MNDWSDRLCEALDEQEARLAESVGLRPGLSGPEFERALGAFLRWQEVRHLDEQFRLLGGPNAGSEFAEAANARANTQRRVDLIAEILRQTLFDNFGARRVDAASATSAYGWLLRELEPESLVCATTNYDLSLEIALRGLGWQPEVGFEDDAVTTPRLKPEGLVDWDETRPRTPVLHLHGAVGWYERDGEVLRHGADETYNRTLGTPVILYPDPEKDPTRDAAAQALWHEFGRALEGATHVLVLGHSLNDPALVHALSRIEPTIHLA